MAVLTGIVDTSEEADAAIIYPPLPFDSVLTYQNNGPDSIAITAGTGDQNRFVIRPNNSQVIFVPKGTSVGRTPFAAGTRSTGSFQIVVPG